MVFNWEKELPLSEKEQAYRALWRRACGDTPPADYLDDLEKMQELCALFWHVKTGEPASRPWGAGRIPFPREQAGAAEGLAVQRHARYFPVALHQHEFVEILCVVQGACGHWAGACRSELFTGDVVVIAPGTRHAFLTCREDTVIYQLLLDLGPFEEQYRGFLQQENLLADFLRQTTYSGGRNSSLLLHTGGYFLEDNALASLLAEYEARGPFRAGKLPVLVQLLFYELLAHQTAPSFRLVDPATPAGRDRMMLAYARAHAATVTQGELCRLFHYSSRQIARIFQKAAGMSFTDYIRQCRLDHAAQLLAQGPIRVKDAMELAGVRSAAQFYREFQARFGLTPAAYRALQQPDTPDLKTKK